MKEIFIKNRVVILRVLSVMMLLIAFLAQFWATPKESLTQNEIAARNVARMEAHVRGFSDTSNQHSSSKKMIEQLKDFQEKQTRYVTIFAMILGVGLLGYSFVKPEKQ